MAAASIIIIIAAITMAAVAAAVIYGGRKRRLRRRFGPEYDRLVAEHHSSRKAEAELSERQRRVRNLDIRPLDPAAQARYSEEWAAAQEMFVDSPLGAVGDAQRLTMTLMNERGYPADQDEQILADLSVYHAKFLDQYRVASAISRRAGEGSASTEDLRQALIYYRALFRDLLGLSRNAAPPQTAVQAPGTTARDGALPAEPDSANSSGTPQSESQRDGAASRAR